MLLQVRLDIVLRVPLSVVLRDRDGVLALDTRVPVGVNCFQLRSYGLDGTPKLEIIAAFKSWDRPDRVDDRQIQGIITFDNGVHSMCADFGDRGGDEKEGLKMHNDCSKVKRNLM